MRYIDLSGKKFGRWLVIENSGSPGKRKEALWKCVCTCGVVKWVLGGSLRAGTSTSCGCALADWLRATKRLKPFESLYNWLKKRAKKYPGPILSYKDFLRFTKIKECVYCGDPVFWTKYNLSKNGMAYNLDRKDSHKGYQKENCVVCCSPCNLMKLNLSSEEFLQRVKKIWKKTSQYTERP